MSTTSRPRTKQAAYCLAPSSAYPQYTPRKPRWQAALVGRDKRPATHPPLPQIPLTPHNRAQVPGGVLRKLAAVLNKQPRAAKLRRTNRRRISTLPQFMLCRELQLQLYIQPRPSAKLLTPIPTPLPTRYYKPTHRSPLPQIAHPAGCVLKRAAFAHATPTLLRPTNSLFAKPAQQRYFTTFPSESWVALALSSRNCEVFLCESAA
jgi:hypothetical protein